MSQNRHFLNIQDEVVKGEIFFRVSFSNYQIALIELNKQITQLCNILNSPNNSQSYSQIQEESLTNFYILHYIFNEMSNNPKFATARQFDGSASELLSMKGFFASRAKIEKEHVHAKGKNENNDKSTEPSFNPNFCR